MSAKTVKIVHPLEGAWAKSPPVEGNRGTIVFDRKQEPWQLWVVDFSKGEKRVTIQNAGSSLFAIAEGDQVVTVRAHVVEPEHLYWEVQHSGSDFTVQVPRRNLYWTSFDEDRVFLSGRKADVPQAQEFTFN